MALIGHQDRVSGVGEAARRLSTALTKSGYNVDHLSVGFASAIATNAFAKSSAVDLSSYAIVIVAVNPDLLPFVLLRNFRTLKGAKFIVAFWSWEFENCPGIWKPISRLVDEVWTISSFSADAISKIARDTPVRVAPLAIPEEFPSRLPGDAILRSFYSSGYKFYFNFDFNSDVTRKNPEAVIMAFQSAFEKSNSDVRLMIKTINADLRPREYRKLMARAGSDPRITFFDGHLTRLEMNWLLKNADVFVSLHKAEGYGINLVDALAQGTRLIASDYSGNLDFVSEENSYLVPGRITNFRKKYGPYFLSSRWFEPSVQSAAALMARAFHADKLYERELKNISSELIQHNESQIVHFGQILNSIGTARRRSLGNAMRYSLSLCLAAVFSPIILSRFLMRKFEELIWRWPAMLTKKHGQIPSTLSKTLE